MMVGVSPVGQDPRPDAVQPASVADRAVVLTAVVLLLVAMAAAITVDVVQSGYGVKSDEATYVGMTLSLAYDHDLAYERRDLDRFWTLYGTGPEGVFLKAGKALRLRLDGSPPFLRLQKLPDPRNDRLYFGKAMIYSVAAAPFVRVLGMNGFLVFHVLLLFAVCACGYVFLRARSEPGPALAFTLAFVGAAVVPIYTVFLMPDLFNFAIVFLAYFFWLYKEVAVPRSRWLAGTGSSVIAAVLLGVATYSKPPCAPLIAPLVVLSLWQKQWLQGFIVGLVFLAVTGGLFTVNALVTGEFNYQGGDRKQFYGSFPFDSSRDVWVQKTALVTTNDSDAESVLAPSEFVGRFSHNIEYFLIGRHFGFVPYFFPGVVVVICWACARDRFRAWRTLTLLGLAGSTAVWLLLAPYSWSGGGGPPGNRYFLSIYPLLFFLMPPIRSTAPALIAWAGGALFTAKILLNPFVMAKSSWEIAEHGAARQLPVELTMANDLPAMLAQPLRGHIPYRNDPLMLLYFLDAHAFPPEPPGMWVSGTGRSDIIVRTENPIHRLAFTAVSPIRTTLTISAGAAVSTIALVPDKTVNFDLPVSGVRGFNSYECLLSAQSSEGFIPHLRDPGSTDVRNLGVLLNFRAY
jgi:hypothetical protein